MDEYKSIDIELGRHAVALARQEWGSLRLNPDFAALAHEPDRTCQAAGDWYVVSIEHQQEDLAKREVAARGMVPYLPMCPKRERHGRGARRTVWRPLLGLYMFVKCLPQQFGNVTSARGVHRFLGMDSRPMAIDEYRIEVIQLVEAEKAEGERKRAAEEDAAAKARAGGRSGIVWDYAEGERVRIRTGAFAGFYADLTAAVDVHDRIRVLVNCFGRRSLVELSAFEIAKAL